MNTYEQLAAFLGHRSSRTVPSIRSTVIVRTGDGAIGVKYHSTIVVLAYPDGFFRLYSGGFRTSTTKSRINEFSPARVYQHKGQWFVADGITFVEGVLVGPTGCTTLAHAS